MVHHMDEYIITGIFVNAHRLQNRMDHSSNILLTRNVPLRLPAWPDFALKVNRYGETETGYLPHLHKTIYRHKGVAMGYGIKLWPQDLIRVKEKAPEAHVLEGL